MSDFKNPNEDELAGTEQQPFVEHLIELRDRHPAALAVLVCFGVLALYPGPRPSSTTCWPCRWWAHFCPRART